MVRTHLRDRLQEAEPVLLPGAYDAMTARIAQRAGFDAVYLSGSALAMSQHGLPDIGLTTATELVEAARRVVGAIDVPVVCDADTGYGNPLNVRRTVRSLLDVGVEGIQLEDQEDPKRCGHFNGKSVLDAREMVAKVQAAVDERGNDPAVIIARTDARAVHGLDDALERAGMFRDAGADVLFVEAPQSVEELERIGASFEDTPLLVNVVEGGRTPPLEFDEYVRLGFRIVLYPTAAVRAAAKAVQRFYQHLHEHRSTGRIEAELLTFDERNELNGLDRFMELDRRYAIEP